MPVCPQCDSYTRAGAAFCSHCGGKLLGGAEPQPPAVRARAPSARPRRIVTLGLAGAILVVLAAVVAILSQPEADDHAGVRTAAGTRVPAVPDPAVAPVPELPPSSTIGALRAEAVGPAAVRPLTGRELSVRLTPSLVVLEFLDRDGNRWSETRGVLVGEDGVVLCRYRPLLGAVRGVARLPDRSADRAEILGVSAYLAAEDLALVRIREAQDGYRAAPLASARIEADARQGDELWVFSNYRALAGVISEPRYTGGDGQLRARLEADDGLPPEAFLAVGLDGAVLGLCRVEVDGRLLDPSANMPQSGYRLLIDSAAPLRAAAGAEAFTTLAELTSAAYEGTFAAHVRRGEDAHRAERWSEAIDAFEKALDRVPYDVPPADDVERVSALLQADYEMRIRELLEADRVRESLAVAVTAVERLPERGALWLLRGAVGLKAGEPPLDCVRALLEARRLGIPAAQWRDLLEEGYALLAQAAQALDDARSEETVLLEGKGYIPDSAVLSLALARLYYRIEVFDEVPQLLVEVDRIDPRMRSATDELRRRIDDAIKNRDSVVIPISPDDRSYRAEVVVDGRVRAGFIIDTGASFTAIPHDLAVNLGYDLVGAERIAIGTAAGVISAPRIEVSSLDVNGYAVRNIRVVVLPQGVGPNEGLLGLNFLRHFKYTVDASRNEFRLQRP